MKFLFVVQGEGRGHLTQAITLERLLTRRGHEVVEVLVGKSKHRKLPAFFSRQIKAPVKRFESPNFLPTPANCKNNLTSSVFYNLTRLRKFGQSIRFLRWRIDESGADVVVNFYELLTGLTYLLCPPRAGQVCIGHQYLFLHPDFEFPKVSRMQLRLLKLFTRATAIGAQRLLALSFRYMPDNEERRLYVVPPLLREEVLRQTPTRGNYILGYMVNAGFAVQVDKWHTRKPQTELRFFWDRRGEKKMKRVDRTLSYHQPDDHLFIKEMAGCKAYATTAGFESVCEAMYMGKPVLMVPAHIEQECNAYDAMRTGAGIVSQDFAMDRLEAFGTAFKPNRNFMFWAQDTDVLVDKLVCPPEYSAEGLYAARFLHLCQRRWPTLYRNVRVWVS